MFTRTALYSIAFNLGFGIVGALHLFNPDAASAQLVGTNNSTEYGDNIEYPVQFPIIQSPALAITSIGNTSCSSASVTTSVFGMHSDGIGANVGGAIGISAPLGGNKECKASLALQNRAMELEVQILEAQYKALQQQNKVTAKTVVPVTKTR